MKTPQQKLIQAKNQLAKQQEIIAKLEAEIKNQPDKDFQVINYKDKEFRIYKWEDKPFKDFVCPKGFRWVDLKEFSDLVNNIEFEWEKRPVWYYSTNLFKNNYWKLARAFLHNGGGWVSDNFHLADSDDYGRVVVRSIK
jgi:hypothetical protein